MKTKPPISPEEDRLLTIEEAMERLACSRTTLYKLFNDRALAFVQLGRSRRVRLSTLLNFVAAAESLHA